jgi:3-oxoacyl-[acyl-carrier protein] reductase
MGKLDGMITLVAGGTGTVGEGIVRAFLKEGATVIVPSRKQESLDKLREYLQPLDTDKLIGMVGNIGNIAEAERMRDEVLSRFSQINAMVASLGGSWEEGLLLTEVSMETWQNYFESNLTSHFVAARTFLPTLAKQPGSSYTLMGGLSAVVTIPRYSPVAINSAGELMLTKILIEEMKDSPVRINEVLFGFINTRARAAYARPEWITADEVGEFLAYLASPAARMISGGIIQLNNRPPVK